MNLGRRNAELVELLQRRLEHLAVARADDRVFRPELDALDDAPAADLEYLDDDAAGAELEAEDVAMAERRRRHLLLPIVEGLHRPHRVARLRGFLEALTGRRIEHPAAQRLDQLVVPALEEQLRRLDGARRTPRPSTPFPRMARCSA